MNGHMLKTIRPTMPHGGIGGGGEVGGQQYSKAWEMWSNGWPIGNTFCIYNAGETGNGHMLNTLVP